jgi:hypothetical protein
LNPKKHGSSPEDEPVVKKAEVRQVITTMLWGLCMIGKKETWEKDGATITLFQAVVGAVITGIAVVFILIMIVRFVVR